MAHVAAQENGGHVGQIYNSSPGIFTLSRERYLSKQAMLSKYSFNEVVLEVRQKLIFREQRV